jgi:hypothetical protein
MSRPSLLNLTGIKSPNKFKQKLILFFEWNSALVWGGWSFGKGFTT